MITDKQLKKLKQKDRVIFDPPGRLFADAEFGYVSSMNEQYVFVKFENDLNRMDGDWDAVTSKACRPAYLTLISNK